MIKKRRYLLLLPIFLGTIFSSVSVLALGVSPAVYKIDFEPGVKKTFSFNFRAESSTQELEIYVGGDLAEYVILSTDHLTGPGRVDVLLQLPSKIDTPGKHRISIGAKPYAEIEGGTVGAVVTVEGAIDIFVPYPGKYAEIDFSIESANQGETIPYTLIVYSRGEEAIVTDSRIVVYDFENKKTDTFFLGSIVISPGESFFLKSELDTLSYTAGNYRAVAVVAYSDQEVRKELQFRLGELFVEVINYTKNFKKEKINPFIIEVESSWNDVIENLFAEVSIINTDVRFLTPSVNLQGFEREELLGYLDTALIETNKFQAKIVLHYADKTTERVVDLELKDEGIDYILIGIIVGVLVVILFLILVILKFKRLEKKNGKAKKKA